jgi:hypothetical protein
MLFRASERWAIEIKLTTYPKAEDLAGLRKAAGQVSATHALWVSRTEHVTRGERESSVSLRCLLRDIARFHAATPFRPH